jgi:phosphate transport system substrate-binding protein
MQRRATGIGPSGSTHMGTDSRRSSAFRLVLYATPICLAAIAGFLYLSGSADGAAREAGSVQIVGSETMRPVVAACAEEFMTRNPQADIIVKGGGSGDGIAALFHGIVDIGMTSRNLSRAERDYAVAKGIEISVFELALDGIAIVVNRASVVAALDLGQLRSIFTGRVRNWRELGGADAEILLFARAAGSGTASLFGERVLGDDAYAASVQRLPTNEAIVAEVAAQYRAIGYTDLGALRRAGDRIKAVALRGDVQSPPVLPTAESIRSGSYPLARSLYLSTAGRPSGTVKAFLDFCSSASGQALLQRAGYVGIHPDR